MDPVFRIFLICFTTCCAKRLELVFGVVCFLISNCRSNRRLCDMIGDFYAWDTKQTLHAKRFGKWIWDLDLVVLVSIKEALKIMCWFKMSKEI